LKSHRVWIEILLLSSIIACAIAILVATLGAAAGASSEAAARQETPSTEGRTYEGMVTCSRCGARHSRALGQTAADCSRLCVRSGASFALVDSDTTYLLEGDLGTLGGLAGKRARVFGELNGNTIRILSIAAQS
jgi:hypothetical protein